MCCGLFSSIHTATAQVDVLVMSCRVAAAAWPSGPARNPQVEEDE